MALRDADIENDRLATPQASALSFARGRIANRLRRNWRGAKHLASESLWMCSGVGLPIRENERRLSALRNREVGKRIFILGNGPSLLKTDVDKLSDEVSIASNAVFLLFKEKSYRPTYYTIEDCLVAEDRAKEASALQGMWKIFPEDVRRYIPADRNTVYVNFIRNSKAPPRFSENCTRAVYWGGTVTFLNLQLAAFLGASQIYLIGFDHDYAPPSAHDEVDGVVITSATRDQNHFDPRYFGPGYRWHDPRVDRMEDSYRLAKDVLASRGIQIFNATAGGKLEVFERVEFDSLFEVRT